MPGMITLALSKGRIFEETKQRPLYLIRQQLGFSQDAVDTKGEE